MRCGWCERDDGLAQVLVEDGVYRSVKERDPATGELVLVDVCVRGPILAYACPDHRAVVWDPSPDVQKVRRRKARGIVQMALFEDERASRPLTHHGRDPDSA